MAHGTCSSILFFFAVTIVGQALTPSSYFTTVDQQRLKAIFEASRPYADVSLAHYSILGLTLLGETIPKGQATESCTSIKNKVEVDNIESIFHAASASKLLPDCKLTISDTKILSEAIAETSPVAKIYFAFFALKNLGLAVDGAKTHKALQASLKTDDGPLSHGYSFLIASELSGADGKYYHDLIEDVVAQADELESTYLQFEGGLYTTSVVIYGAYKLAGAQKKAPTITSDQVIKFSNYFLSRKHVHQTRAGSHMLGAVSMLTGNAYHVPVATILASPMALSVQNSKLQVRVTDLLGRDLGKMAVTADSAKHVTDDAVIISKKQFTAVAGDATSYELDFMGAKPTRGFYKIVISSTPSKKEDKLIGLTGAEVTVKVTTEVKIESVDIGVADKDQTSAAKTTKLQHPNKAANVLEADHHQKVLLKFQLRDVMNSQLMKAHQTFIRLTNQKSRQEIIFTANSDPTLMYKFNLDVGASGKEFGWLSGRYTMELIVGDAVITNAFSWVLADVMLTFPDELSSGAGASDKLLYAAKPEIRHLFREPEKRPPVMVSTTFTFLVLLPFVILLILWIRLGVNVSNFPASVSAVGFHICLAAIFGLYYCYWAHLNMFSTLRYLSILVIPTFIFGNRLLNAIATHKKK